VRSLKFHNQLHTSSTRRHRSFLKQISVADADCRVYSQQYFFNRKKRITSFLSIYIMSIRNLKRISLEVLVVLFFITQIDCFSRHACRKLNPATNTLAGSWTRSVSIHPSNSQYDYQSGFAKERECATRISATQNSDVDLDDPFFDPMNIPKFVGGQSILILIAIAAASIFSVPNFGLGEGFVLNKQSILDGVIATLPLGLFAFVLDKIEP